MSQLTCIYASGKKVIFQSDSLDFAAEYGTIEKWKEYSMKWRFGCALFIDGECVYKGVKGYHSDEDLAKYSAEITGTLASNSMKYNVDDEKKVEALTLVELRSEVCRIHDMDHGDDCAMRSIPSAECTCGKIDYMVDLDAEIAIRECENRN